MLSKQLYMTSYPSVYNIAPSIFITSFLIHMLSPYCFHDNTATIPGISPTIFDLTATVSVSSHRWHTHLYRCITLFLIHMLSPYCFHDNTATIPGISPTIFDLTATVSVSSHRWHTHLYRCITLSMTSQQVCKSSHLAHG